MTANQAQHLSASVCIQDAIGRYVSVQHAAAQRARFVSVCIALAAALTLPVFALIFPLAALAQATPVKSLKEIRERGIVMQQWENSCAAASVATVLTYGFRDPVTERYAAAKMLENTDGTKVRARGGFSLLDLRHFVQDRGYQGDAYQGLSIEDLKVFHAPIVPISTLGYNHYVVFNGVKGDQVFLADPAFGHRRMSQKEFSRVWMDGMAFVVTRPAQTTEAADGPPLEIPWPWGLPPVY
jgi:hypothetical protein